METQKDIDYSGSFSAHTWTRFFAFLKPLRGRFVRTFGVMILLAVLDNITPFMMRITIDRYISHGIKEGLIGFGIIFFILIFLQSFSMRLYIMMGGGIEIEAGRQLRRQGFVKLQSLPLAYYDKTAIGWILARMVTDASNLSEMIAWSLTEICWTGSTIIVIIIILLVMNTTLALYSFLVIPLLIVASVLYQRAMLPLERKRRREHSHLAGAYNEGIMGACTSKTLNRERANTEEFTNVATALQRHAIRTNRLSSIFTPLTSLLGAIAAAIVLSVGGARMSQHLIEIGTLYAFFIYTLMLWEPIRGLSVIFRDLQSSQTAAERVMHLLNEPNTLVDRDDVIARYGLKDGAGREPWPDIKGRLTFDHVTFAYGDGAPVLIDFCLDVQPGQTIALVGETGAGKSTIVNLLCRFYEPTSGAVLIDGVDTRERPLPWLHSHLGYVLQTPHLFSGTIRDNIRYGDLKASDDEVEAAARLVHAHDIICRHEHGYDTQVGEGGARLSTGEKQLISFARAVLSNPALFLLDEATASIDTETEHALQDALETIRQNRTMVVIAHRLSTIRNADRILVIQAGKIVESGTHDELIAHKGRYAELYRLQSLKEQAMKTLQGPPVYA